MVAGFTVAVMLFDTLEGDIAYWLFLAFAWAFVGFETAWWPIAAGCYGASCYVILEMTKRFKLKERVLDAYAKHSL